MPARIAWRLGTRMGTIPKLDDCEQKRAKQEVSGLDPQFTKEEQDLTWARSALFSPAPLPPFPGDQVAAGKQPQIWSRDVVPSHEFDPQPGFDV